MSIYLYWVLYTSDSYLWQNFEIVFKLESLQIICYYQDDENVIHIFISMCTTLKNKYLWIKVDYHLGDIFADLLTFAANSLVEGGRLVFWIPVNREHYSEEKLPTHPNLRMVANCEQWLSSHTSRRCLVLEKVNTVSNFCQTLRINKTFLKICYR